MEVSLKEKIEWIEKENERHNYDRYKYLKKKREIGFQVSTEGKENR